MYSHAHNEPAQTEGRCFFVRSGMAAVVYSVVWELAAAFLKPFLGSGLSFRGTFRCCLVYLDLCSWLAPCHVIVRQALLNMTTTRA